MSVVSGMRASNARSVRQREDCHNQNQGGHEHPYRNQFKVREDEDAHKRNKHEYQWHETDGYERFIPLLRFQPIGAAADDSGVSRKKNKKAEDDFVRMIPKKSPAKYYEQCAEKNSGQPKIDSEQGFAAIGDGSLQIRLARRAIFESFPALSLRMPVWLENPPQPHAEASYRDHADAGDDRFAASFCQGAPLFLILDLPFSPVGLAEMLLL